MKSKIIALLLIILLVSNCKRHKSNKRHSKSKKQLCDRKCEEYKESALKLWKSTLFCGDKWQMYHTLQYNDEQCCLVAPNTCGRSFKGTVVKGVQFNRLKKINKKDEENNEEKHEEEKHEDNQEKECMYCVEHTCTQNMFGDHSKVQCIASIYLCASQADKDEVHKYIDNVPRNEYKFITSDRRRLKHSHFKN